MFEPNFPKYRTDVEGTFTDINFTVLKIRLICTEGTRWKSLAKSAGNT